MNNSNVAALRLRQERDWTAHAVLRAAVAAFHRPVAVAAEPTEGPSAKAIPFA